MTSCATIAKPLYASANINNSNQIRVRLENRETLIYPNDYITNNTLSLVNALKEQRVQISITSDIDDWKKLLEDRGIFINLAGFFCEQERTIYIYKTFFDPETLGHEALHYRLKRYSDFIYNYPESVYYSLSMMRQIIELQGDSSKTADFDRYLTSLKYNYANQLGEVVGKVKNKQMTEEEAAALLSKFFGGFDFRNMEASDGEKYSIFDIPEEWLIQIGALPDADVAEEFWTNLWSMLSLPLRQQAVLSEEELRFFSAPAQRSFIGNLNPGREALKFALQVSDNLALSEYATNFFSRQGFPQPIVLSDKKAQDWLREIYYSLPTVDNDSSWPEKEKESPVSKE
jgi:hypothetical protein